MGIYLAILSIQDIRHKKIWLWMIVVIIGAGGIYAWLNGHGVQILWDVIPGGLFCILALWIPDVMGLGDGLVAIIYGLFFGWKSTCIWLMFAFALSAVVGMGICVFQHKSKIQIPFIPFLTIVHVGMCL